MEQSQRMPDSRDSVDSADVPIRRVRITEDDRNEPPSAAEPVPYPDHPPTDAQLEKIYSAIRETGMPENVPTLAWSKPPKDCEHALLLPKITVDKRKRPDETMVPCAVCSDMRPKCFSLYLLWSSDGRLRAVGHKCGPKHFGHAEFRELQRKAQSATSKKANENFLLDNLPNGHHWLLELDRLLPICTAAESAKRAFMRGVPSLHQELYRMAREHAGALVVLRRRETTAGGPAGFQSSLGGSASEFIPIEVAALRGTDFLVPSFNPASEHSRIVSAIKSVIGRDREARSDDDILNLVCALDDVRLTESVQALRSAHRRAHTLSQRLSNLVLFVSDANLNQLEKWVAHEENTFQFTLKYTAQDVSFRGYGGERVTIQRKGLRAPPPFGFLGLRP